MKETSGANVTRVLVTVLNVFLILVLTPMTIVRFTLLEPGFWKDLMRSFNVEEIVKYDSTQFMAETPIGEIDMSEEVSIYVDFLTDEFGEYLDGGDTTVSDEDIDEVIAQIRESMEEKGLPEDYIDTTTGKLREPLTKIMDNVDSQLKELVRLMERVNTGILIAIIVMAALVLGLTGLAVAMHKNRWKPIRNLGISLTIAHALLFVAPGFVFLMAGFGLKNSSTGPLSDFLNGKLASLFFGFFGLFALLLVVSVAVLVLGSIMSSRWNRTIDEDSVTYVDEA